MTARVDETFHGWMNPETCSVALHFAMDAKLTKLVQDGRPWDVVSCEEFVHECFPFGTPDMKRASDLSEVDYLELAEAWNEES